MSETKTAEKPVAATEEAGTEKKAVVKAPTTSAKKSVSTGKAYVLSTFNNTIITLTDQMGNAIAWSSAGHKGFRGSRKNTPFAAQVAAEEAARKAYDLGLRSVSVYVSGPGSGRESALRAISMAGIRVTYIEDTTPIPHNGCRPPKRRRV
jgi:small subunit ribosomal protein S11